MLDRTQKRVGHERERHVGGGRWEKGKKKRRKWDGSFIH